MTDDGATTHDPSFSKPTRLTGRFQVMIVLKTVDMGKVGWKAGAMAVEDDLTGRLDELSQRHAAAELPTASPKRP